MSKLPNKWDNSRNRSLCGIPCVSSIYSWGLIYRDKMHVFLHFGGVLSFLNLFKHLELQFNTVWVLSIYISQIKSDFHLHNLSEYVFTPHLSRSVFPRQPNRRLASPSCSAIMIDSYESQETIEPKVSTHPIHTHKVVPISTCSCFLSDVIVTCSAVNHIATRASLSSLPQPRLQPGLTWATAAVSTLSLRAWSETWS